MASSKEYLHFILEQLSDLEEINYRAMMGDEMKMNIHKNKMLWYNTKYCVGLLMRETEI